MRALQTSARRSLTRSSKSKASRRYKCTILTAVAGALRRCLPLAVLVPRRDRRLAPHPATTAILAQLIPARCHSRRLPSGRPGAGVGRGESTDAGWRRECRARIGGRPCHAQGSGSRPRAVNSSFQARSAASEAASGMPSGTACRTGKDKRVFMIASLCAKSY